MSAPSDIRIGQLFSLVKRQQPMLRPLNESARTGDSSKPILYCVHSLSGMVTEFLPLANLLDSKVRVFGFQVPRQRMRDPDFPASVIGLADIYADCISASQPEGPIFLTGLSAGGLVAHDMAVTLTSRGRQVGLLAILDIVPYANQPRIRPFRRSYLFAVARNLPYWLAYELERDDSGFKNLAGRAVRRTGSPGGRVRSSLSGPEASLLHPIHRFIDLKGYLEDHRAFICRFFSAITLHQPRSGPCGRLVVYEAMAKPVLRPTHAGEVWTAYASDASVLQIRTMHRDMVNPPYVNMVAADLAARISPGCATASVAPAQSSPRAAGSTFPAAAATDTI